MVRERAEIISYLTFGRHREFFIQSVVLSSLFLIAGRIWNLPITLVSIGNSRILLGLFVLFSLIFVLINIVVYLSGQQTYSPRFNQLSHCIFASLLQVVFGSILISATYYFIILLFDIIILWPVSYVIASLLVIGSIFALAVVSWHYQRVLTVEYDSSIFDDALEQFLNNLEDVPQSSGIPRETMEKIAESIRLLDENQVKPRLNGEQQLNETISEFRSRFFDEEFIEQEMIIQGDARKRTEIHEDLNEAHRILNELKSDLEKIR